MSRARLAIAAFVTLLVGAICAPAPAAAQTPGTGAALIHGAATAPGSGIGDTFINGLVSGVPISRDIPFYGAEGGVAGGDVNGDGIDEVIVANGAGSFTVFDQFGVRILLPGGPAPFTRGDVIAAGDINNDGFDEIVVGHSTSINNLQLIQTFGGPTNNFFPSNSTPDFFGGAIAVCDLNNDGYAEIIVGTGGTLGSVQVFSNIASSFGTFFPGTRPQFLVSTDKLACADLNGDGFNDLIVLHPARPSVGLTATQFEFFTDLSRPPVHYFLNDIPPDVDEGSEMAAGDLDGDGFAEIVIGHDAFPAGGHIQVYSIAGKTPPVVFPLGPTAPFIPGSDALAVGTHPLPAGAAQSASVCTVWNANYIDNALGDDVASTPGIQHVPASFAGFEVQVGGQRVAFGSLDVNGCADISSAAFTPQGQLAHPGATWTLLTTSVMTNFLTGGPLTVNVQERQTVPAPANAMVETSMPTKPVTVMSTFSVQGAGTTTVTPTMQNSVTAASAFVSAALARNSQPGGDVGLKPGSLRVFAGQGCPQSGNTCDDKSNDALGNSCAIPNCGELFLSPGFTPAAGSTCPANIGVGAAHWKFVIAHEFGHIIQGNFGVSIEARYTPTPGGRPAVCRCDHVLVSNQEHCMQSIQRASDSQVEGFAQFYAANMWNSLQRQTCTFEYYKEFLVPQQPSLPSTDFRFVDVPAENANPGLTTLCANGAALPPGTGGANSFYSILPPMAVDCFGNPAATEPRGFVNYRTQGGCWTTPNAADYSTEFDWMKFYMNLNRSPDPATAVSVSQLLNVYASICNGTTSCGGTLVNGVEIPPESTPTWTGLLAAATAQLSSDQARAFQTAGKTFGVDNNL